MLAFLLDEHISPEVARIMSRRRPEIPVFSILHWENGIWKGQVDERILRAAKDAGLTLVSYDRRTIPSLLCRWAENAECHAGVVFVDERTIRPHRLSGLASALIRMWDSRSAWDWIDRIGFLDAVE
jgi:hypothetical protein